jgi:hypothetical protein
VLGLVLDLEQAGEQYNWGSSSRSSAAARDESVEAAVERLERRPLLRRIHPSTCARAPRGRTLSATSPRASTAACAPRTTPRRGPRCHADGPSIGATAAPSGRRRSPARTSRLTWSTREPSQGHDAPGLPAHRAPSLRNVTRVRKAPQQIFASFAPSPCPPGGSPFDPMTHRSSSPDALDALFGGAGEPTRAPPRPAASRSRSRGA